MDDIMYRVHAELEESHWWFVGKNRILRHLIKHYGQGAPAPAGARGRALDVGCGAGGMLALLQLDYDAVGMDMSPIARVYCEKRGLRAVDGMLPDALPFEPGTFDVVVASEVLEHVDDDRGSAAALCRLLRPGGLLVCTSPAHQWLWSSHDDVNQHKRRYTLGGFESIFEGLPLKRELTSYSMCAMFPLLAVLRLAGRALGVSLGAGQSSSAEVSIRTPPALVNRTLCALFASERWVLPRMRIPMGSSVISVHRRTGEAETPAASPPHQDAVEVMGNRASFAKSV